ncbi:hypothetical protein AAE478_006213 [Parahypoxylon ruwenzoriense]
MPSPAWSAGILLSIAFRLALCSPEACALLGADLLIPNNIAAGRTSKRTQQQISAELFFFVTNASSSAIQLEAWLPDPQSWNRRFLATGSGGIGGGIDYATMQNGLRLGFSFFGTNAGNNGPVGYEFFLNKLEAIDDFGHRAIHVEAEAGMELVRLYYGTGAAETYYVGCSTGGRQGFQNAHLYPEDFDGMLLGSPDIDWLRIVASKGILAVWQAIVEAQIRQLDSLDGVTNGIIDEPTKHRFDPARLVCGTSVLNSTLCLSPQQVESVRRAYEPIESTSGRIVYPAFEPGSKTDVFSQNQVHGTAKLTYTHNALLSLVEQGMAPKILVSTKYEDDVVGGKIVAQRTYYPYPMVSKWVCVNDTSLAASGDVPLPGLEARCRRKREHKKLYFELRPLVSREM